MRALSADLNNPLETFEVVVVNDIDIRSLVSPVNLFRVCTAIRQRPLFLMTLMHSLSPSEWARSYKLLSSRLLRQKPGKVENPTGRILYTCKHQLSTAILYLLLLPYALKYRRLVTTCHYDTVPKALCIAFKSLSKIVIEVQHGLIYPLHPAYRIATRDSISCPDKIFYWDQPSKEALTRFQKSGGLIQLSSYFHFLGSQSNVPLSVVPSNQPIVFYTLTYEKAVPESVIRTIKANAYSISWIFRWHPMGPPPMEEHLLCLRDHPSVFLDQTCQLDLIQCISAASLHVSFSSSVVALCSAFRLRSFLTNAESKEFFIGYSDLVEYVSDENLAELIVKFFNMNVEDK